MQVSLQRWEGGKTYFLWRSMHLKIAMNAINRVFLLATSFDHTQLCHVLPQLCMLKLSVGKGHQVHKLIHVSAMPWMQCATQCYSVVHAHGVCTPESSSLYE